MKKQTLSFQRLQFYINYDKGKTPTKSGITPPAPTTTLLQPGSADVTPLFAIARNVIQNVNIPKVFRAVVELQMLYGLRITECLNITVADVSKHGHIKIRGSKGSNNRIVIPHLMLDFWLTATPSVLPIGNLYSRFWFYRYYKRVGLYAQFGSNQVKSATHLFRHLTLLQLKENFNDSNLSRQFIGHKNIKSTQHYEQREKK